MLTLVTSNMHGYQTVMPFLPLYLISLFNIVYIFSAIIFSVLKILITCTTTLVQSLDIKLRLVEKALVGLLPQGLGLISWSLLPSR